MAHLRHHSHPFTSGSSSGYQFILNPGESSGSHIEHVVGRMDQIPIMGDEDQSLASFTARAR
jgi:hypothetical protein